jgi:oligopeptidase B
MAKIFENKKSIFIITLLILILLIISQFYKGANKMHTQPIAKKVPTTSTWHGKTLVDNYAWLRDDNWPNVAEPILSHLKAENDFADLERKNFEAIEEQLFLEMKSRIIENDVSYPVQKKDYLYFRKTIGELNHPIFYRKSITPNSKEECLLDPNQIAKDNKAFSLGSLVVSTKQNLMAFSYDMQGKERYLIRVKNLQTDELLEDLVDDTSGELIWDSLDQGFFYLKLDENWRSNRLFYHKLGTKRQDDILIFHEQDNTFRISIHSSSNEKLLFVYSRSATVVGVSFLELEQPLGAVKEIYSKDHKHLLDIDQHKDFFYMNINDKGSNFRLVKFPITNFDKSNWQEVVAHNQLGYISDFYALSEYIVINSKQHGLQNIYVLHEDKLYSKIPFNEPLYEADAVFTEYNSNFIRVQYSSMVTPPSVMEFNLDTILLETKKTQAVPGYISSNYESKRIFVQTRDGAQVPVSMVYKKDLVNKHEPNKMLLYAYGSYGYGMTANFNPTVISLLDRGYIFAISHIRGGDEMGFDWYEQAKFLNKKVTFNDFLDVSKELIAKRYTTPDRLAIMGGSAGGMLMGVVINEHPELYKAVLALVPFVDVLNTMLDENLPLTPGEFKEWGNPKEEVFFDYIQSYSPYENVKSQNYPNMLVTAGINDPRVTYWEPAKWVAKLREYKTDNNTLIFKTELEQGHKGQSGRYNRIREYAFYYAFVIYSIK